VESIKQVFHVDRNEIAYLRVIFESYDGMAVVRTLDPWKALIEIQVAPGCLDMVRELVKDLIKREEIKLVLQL
jgi:Domain of unknown function (DUF4911)